MPLTGSAPRHRLSSSVSNYRKPLRGFDGLGDVTKRSESSSVDSRATGARQSSDWRPGPKGRMAQASKYRCPEQLRRGLKRPRPSIPYNGRRIPFPGQSLGFRCIEPHGEVKRSTRAGSQLLSKSPLGTSFRKSTDRPKCADRLSRPALREGSDFLCEPFDIHDNRIEVV